MVAVKHHEQASRFEITIEGHVAVLEYAIAGGRIDMHHTFVPPELRGKGLAGVLADVAIGYAKQNELEIIPSCSFVAKYLERAKG